MLVVSLCFAQEPLAFRRAEIDFAWSSLGRIGLAMAALAPGLRALSRAPHRSALEGRLSTSPSLHCIARGTGASAVAVLTGGLHLLVCITVERITWGETSSAAVACFAVQTALLALVLGPLSLFLDWIPGTANRALAWLILLATLIASGSDAALPQTESGAPFRFDQALDPARLSAFCLASLGAYLLALSLPSHSRRD